jgi:hypothetical protein
MGCMVYQPFVAGGNRSYPKFWTVIGGPRYPRYFTPTILNFLLLCLSNRKSITQAFDHVTGKGLTFSGLMILSNFLV